MQSLHTIHSYFPPFSPSLEGRQEGVSGPLPVYSLMLRLREGKWFYHSHTAGGGGVDGEVGRREILAFEHILSSET